MLNRLKNLLAHLLTIYELPYWIAAISVGLIAVAYAVVFSWAERFVQYAVLAHPYIFLCFAPLLFCASWAVIHFFAPCARGSGIPQVLVSIQLVEKHQDEKKVASLIGIKTTLVKILSSTLCVLGGGAIGREGPTIQVSAAIFYFVAKKFENITDYRYRLNHEFWLVAGGAAGLAAAFNTPLGGLVYAIEELATANFNRFKTSLITAVIISGFASQWVSGPYLYLGFPKLLSTNVSIVPWSILIGILCGVAGGFFSSLLATSIHRVSQFTFQRRMLLAALCGLFLTLSAIFLEPEVLGPGKQTIVKLLFTNNTDSSWSLAFFRFIGPIVTYITGTAGGIFAPSLAAGAGLGHLIAQLVHTSYANQFVLLGMIAFLTGVTHTPFTSFVLVLEMTDRHSAIFPMMLTALVASKAVHMIQARSFYEIMKEDFLPSENTAKTPQPT